MYRYRKRLTWTHTHCQHSQAIGVVLAIDIIVQGVEDSLKLVDVDGCELTEGVQDKESPYGDTHSVPVVAQDLQ